MPTFLVLTFPLGRYHATPWGRHVNEGAVELPPSSWRLLRMLYSVWRTRAPELDESAVHELLARLAEPPTWHVPRHITGHTRHYYPDAKDGRDRTLDTFAAVERGSDLTAEWPFELPERLFAVLERLAGSIPYFGRADSVCLGSLPSRWIPDAHDTWSPVDVADSVDQNAPVTATLAPRLPLDIPTLLATPAEVRTAGLPLPPGAHLIGYQLRHAAPAPTRSVSVLTARPVVGVRFSLLRAALPPETDAVVYADLLRQAAIKNVGERAAGTVLGGRAAEGTKAAGNHQHAHFLPIIAGRRVTGLVVWTPGGLPPDELKALTAVRRLYSPVKDSWRAEIRVAGIGDIDTVAPDLCGRGHRVWRSVSPFTPSRYPKRLQEWTDFVVAEVSRELSYRDINTSCSVQWLHNDGMAFLRHRPSARLRRDPRQGQATQPPSMLRLTFTDPVTGPLALGHLAHFGLGLFVPDDGHEHR